MASAATRWRCRRCSATCYAIDDAPGPVQCGRRECAWIGQAMRIDVAALEIIESMELSLESVEERSKADFADMALERSVSRSKRFSAKPVPSHSENGSVAERVRDGAR